MQLLEAIKLALAQIRVQKLKSFFTLLGVTIGVMFLIAVVSIVEGMSRYMEEDFVGKLMGVNTFELRRFPSINIGNTTDEQWRAWTRRPYISEGDARAVAAALPAGTKWSMHMSVWQAELSSAYARPRKLQLFAVAGDYFEIKRVDIASGRALAPQEIELGSKVAVIGQEVARHFFPNVDPIGREISIAGTRYQVVGVADKQGSIFGMSLDKFAIVPLRSPARRLAMQPGMTSTTVGTVSVKAPTALAMADAMEETRQIMRGRHKLRPAQPDDFDMSTSQSALAFWAKIKGYMQAAGVALPAIGLVVGAMVIMNIMLVAVAERTREIGVRKALGARRTDILGQFIAESATLSTVGAAFGVALGIGLAGVVKAASPLPVAVAPWSIVVGVLVGTGVGIVAGIYPASRAARLDPILAIRQE
ncbi:MAG TPA: ABC transporter permease [Gemmatimonadaceae bacterium]|nr:ABC transporter permease [Gemmatimonadaceae bacterium]